jgi:hypothetical protein
MVASQRKYVDPSQAVDILRGSIGSGNGGSGPQNGGAGIPGPGDNDQQVPRHDPRNRIFIIVA